MIRREILVALSTSLFMLLGTACIGLDDTDEIVLPPFYDPDPNSREDPDAPPPNQPPEARVQLAHTVYTGGAIVTLDGSASSDPEGDPITFSWGMTGKASVYQRLFFDELPDISLAEPNAASPTFTAPLLPSAVRYTFSTTVRDDHGNQDVAFAVLTVVASGPVADAGPDQTVTEGDEITLDASASYHIFGGQITRYFWQQVPLPNVPMLEINDAETTVVIVTVPAVGQDPVTFRFLVLIEGDTDDGRISDNDWMEVTVLPEGYIPPPIADAGQDQHNPSVGDLVTLDGSGSQIPSGGQATYTWTQVSPAEPVINFDLSDPMHPTFTAPDVSLRTIFRIQLEVYDDLSQRSATDTMIVAVTQLPDPDPDPEPDPGPGGFTEQIIDGQISQVQDVEPVDIDNDGDIDVIVALGLTDAVRLYLNDGTGRNWTTVEVSGVGTIAAMDVCAGDIDNDGDLDIAAVGVFNRNADSPSAGEVVWYENPGVPTGTWTTHQVTLPRFSFWGARSIECLDLTGNGFADLVVGAIPIQTGVGTLGNGLYWIRNLGGGAEWSAPTAIDAGLQGVEKVLRHDVDGDGIQDLLALGRLSDEIAWYRTVRANGDASFQKHLIATPLLANDIELANIDQDADLELLVVTPDYSVGLVSYDPTADPSAAWTLGTIDAAFNGLFARIAADDFSGDGVTDIAVGSLDATALRVYTRLPGGWTAETIASGYEGLTAIAAANLDGANSADLLTTTYADNSGIRLSVWLNSR